MMVYSCSSCAFRSNTHILIKHQFSCHSVELSFSLTCPIQGCSHLFKIGSTYSSFKTHASRKHKNWQHRVEVQESSEPSSTSVLSEFNNDIAHDELDTEQLRYEQFTQNPQHDDDVESTDKTVAEYRMDSQKVAALFLLQRWWRPISISSDSICRANFIGRSLG